MSGCASFPAYGELRPVTAEAAVLLARNPSPMTLEGTNSWVLQRPHTHGCVVIDPGPDDPDHLDRLAARQPDLIVLTHFHADHAAGAARLGQLTGAPVRALDAALCRGAGPLTDGETLDAAGMRLEIIATPGHTGDSICLVLPGAVLTGDTVLGRGTTVIAAPDGDLADYLATLDRLAGLGPRVVLPGHGPELPDLTAVVSAYAVHRRQRIEQVIAALAALGPDTDAAAVVRHVYADVDPALWPAAEWTVQATLEYLGSR